ncbi:TrkA family potassium uptake protein [Tessaracoccus sp. SD287]|uniref:potassium channel family protein n=1 Tax=Tessaracoccus sp. SD287 TaxID=2782008 RepID=UPI001A9609A9|nr:TrkA family potassium uptake protein [Tessaracoccus sp. SD287]MBO1031239.1 TrkA family potassium uptake protein [Tessaracoccus sp. SD287]
MARPRLFGGTDPADVASANAVAVIGLGRFGQSLALELVDNDTEVLAIDAREDVVQALNGRLTHVVRGDATREEVLRQLAIPEFDRVVVAIGSDVEASILVTSLLLRFKVRHIWAKAVSEAHGTILEQLGVQHVVYPEKDMGKRVAHLVRGSMQDYIEIEPGFALIKTTVPASAVGVPLGQSKVRTEHGVTVAAVKRAGQPWTYATETTVLERDDIILVTGPTQKAERFSQRD